jgi:hypothetical protein
MYSTKLHWTIPISFMVLLGMPPKYKAMAVPLWRECRSITDGRKPRDLTPMVAIAA